LRADSVKAEVKCGSSIGAMRHGAPGGLALRTRSRIVGIGLAALILALSAGVAHAVFGSLTFVEFDQDGVGGVDGLNAALGVATSPDGAHVYVASVADNAVVTFSRDSATGALTFVEQDKDGVAGVDGLSSASHVAPSPDGAHVYVTGEADDAVVTFSRDPTTGALTWVEQDKDGVGGVDGLNGAFGVAASPDGAHVYVTGVNDDAVATFSRDPATGALTWVEQNKDGVGTVDGLDGARGIAAPPDGAHVYVTGQADDAVVTFSRDPATGALTWVEQDKDGVGGVDGLDLTRGVAASPDGAHVYATGFDDDAVATFARNSTTGALTFVEQDKDGVGGVDGLDAAFGVAAAPDAAHVYVAGLGDNAVATFARDSATGALSFVELDRDGVEGVDGLDGARGVGASPDGVHVYVTSTIDHAVATFAREGPPAPGEEPPAPVGPTLRTISLDASKAKKGKQAGKEPLLAIKKGKKARFSGDVSAPQNVAGCEANQTVELQRKKPKKTSFSTFKQLQTDAAGAFSTKQKIKKTFEYRAVVVETAACDDAASQTEKVKAKKRRR
jgi:6-phosphogluconolactonase (cycloisomerase 2 family)